VNRRFCLPPKRSNATLWGTDVTFRPHAKTAFGNDASTGQNRFSTRIVVALIGVIGIFYAVTLQPGFPWGDDFAMYLLHAKNIAGGLPYAKTPYIYNPAQPEVGPPSYPPLFPALLAPVVAAADLNSKIIKAVVAVVFLAALWTIYKCLLHRVPGPYAAAAVGVIGFSPYLWKLKDNPVSDVPFLFLLFLTFTCVLDADRKGWKAHGPSILVGVLLYLCFACRAAGIVLFPSLFLWEVLHSRRLPRRGVWVSLIVGSAGVALQALVIRGEASYADQVHFSASVMARHLAEYAWSLRSEFLAMPNLAGTLFLSLLILLGLAGYAVSVRRGITLLEVFTPAYLVIVALWTSDQDLRFLLPVIPLWLLYAGAAIVWLRDFGGRWYSRSLAFTLALIVAFSYLNYFARASYGRDPSGTNDAGFLSVCRFVRDNTPQDAVILFSKPRLLALFTGRKSAVYPLGTAAEIIGYGRRIGARYVILGDPFENDRRILAPAVTTHREVFEGVFHSVGFAVYQIRRGQ
jgi:hypothetical protein